MKITEGNNLPHMRVLGAQLCPTLCNTMDCSPPGSSVHWIFQARILEWVAIPFSRGSSRPRYRTQLLTGLDSLASLIVQCLKICLAIQETQVQSLSQQDPTCHGATKPVCHDYWACTPRAHVLQRQKPSEWEACELQLGKVKVAQSCPTLCDLMECSLPASHVHGILQTRVLEWAAIPFSRGSSQPRDWTQVSHIAGKFFISWATREIRDHICSLLLFLLLLCSNVVPFRDSDSIIGVHDICTVTLTRLLSRFKICTKQL